MGRQLVVLETHPNIGGSWVGMVGDEQAVAQYLNDKVERGGLDYVRSIHELSDGADDEIDSWILFEDGEPVDLKNREVKEGETSYYLIHVWQDVEPEMHGPYATEDERDKKAKQLRADEGDEHGLYPLDMGYKDGKPELLIDTYSGAFFEE